MFEAVHDVDGHPFALVERLLPSSFLVCELEVDEFFDQTPGPRAGARLDAP
jgi:hypothetical protein